MTSTYYALIADPAGKHILMSPTESGWTLPRLSIAEDFWWQDVGPVNRAAHAQWGWRVNTLNCVQIIGVEGDEAAKLIYALEPQALNGYTPDGTRWVEADAVRTLTLVWPEQQDLIAIWLASQTTTAVPWYRPGWRAGALRWAQEQLTQRGLALSAEPEQVRAWERSALWRFHTTGGRFYFKAVTETFAHEPRLSQALGKWLPHDCAPVLAIEPTQRWLLLGDAGPRSLLRDRDATKWEAALRQYAELQIALTSRVNDLLALGVPDRRLEALPERLETLLADTAALKNSPAGLSDDEIVALRKRQPEQLLDACRALAASPIPASLEHGDFASGQIIADANGAYKFIDWSDSSVSFPFFSLLFFWAELQGELDRPTEARLRLRDAYLEPWTAYASRRELLELYELAMAVSPLHHAIIYHQSILPRMAFKWEMERMLPYYLRLAVRE
jgi:hypothetical protein